MASCVLIRRGSRTFFITIVVIRYTTMTVIRRFFLFFFTTLRIYVIHAGPESICPLDFAGGQRTWFILEISVNALSEQNDWDSNNRCDQWLRGKGDNAFIFVKNKKEADAAVNKNCFAGGKKYNRITVDFKNEKSEQYYNEALNLGDVSLRVDLASKTRIILKLHFTAPGYPYCKNSYTDGCDKIDFCWYPRIIPYHPNTLTNGQALVEYPYTISRFDIIYIIGFYTVPFAKKCEPGFFSTCKNQSKCEHNIPLAPDIWETPRDTAAIYPDITSKIEHVPIGHCYPCSTGLGRSHYSFKDNVLCNTYVIEGHEECRSELYDITSFNRIWCPGGSSPPIMCPEGSIASEDKDKCVCLAGKYFDISQNMCIDCNSAHYCVEGVQYLCEDGTYQPYSGQSSCLNCAGVDDISSVGCPVNSLPAKCTLANDPINFLYLRERQCIPCIQCKNSIIQNSIGRTNGVTYVDCYEDQ